MRPRPLALVVLSIAAVLGIAAALWPRSPAAPLPAAPRPRAEASPRAEAPVIHARAARPSPSLGVPEDEERAPADPSDPRERRLARAQQSLDAYLRTARYPPGSRPIEERPDLARPHAVPARQLPLARADQRAGRARVMLRQDRYYLSGDESITLSAACSIDDAPARCEVRAAGVRRPDGGDPAPLTFEDDGNGAISATFQPSSQGFADHHGPLRVELDLRVGAEDGGASFDLELTPVAPAAFTGAFREALEDGSLALYAGVRVAEAGRYVVRARVEDAEGKPFAFLSASEVLAAGAREVKFTVFGKLVRDAGARAPFRVRDVEGFLLREDTYPDRATMRSLDGVVHTTRAYAPGDFSDAEWESPEKERRTTLLERAVEGAGR